MLVLWRWCLQFSSWRNFYPNLYRVSGCTFKWDFDVFVEVFVDFLIDGQLTGCCSGNSLQASKENQFYFFHISDSWVCTANLFNELSSFCACNVPSASIFQKCLPNFSNGSFPLFLRWRWYTNGCRWGLFSLIALRESSNSPARVQTVLVLTQNGSFCYIGSHPVGTWNQIHWHQGG